MSLGEDVAENEQQRLPDYFIVTAAYQKALRDTQSAIYVGRKGSGKTANLYKIADELRPDRRNHVCIIKPISYELEGVVSLLREARPRSEQGYLIESLWKFLIYTELALSIHEQVLSKPAHYARTLEETLFLEFVDNHKELILPEFTVRMERAVRDLCGIGTSPRADGHRARVSETLHIALLGNLREALGKVLEKKRVCILVDNLDKAWIRGGDLDVLSDFLFGLLGVSRTISEEFQKRGSTWRPVRLSVLIFLRSDIFSHIMDEARERDKLAFERLHWNDPRLLQNVIEERFLNSLGETLEPERIWADYFVKEIDGMPTKDYLISRTIPRPRDIIYLCKAALSHAINHRHSRIEHIDVLQAEKEYSHYAFNSLEAETSTQLERCEALLYEFVGVSEIVTRKDIERFAEKAGIPSERVNDAIDLLCDSTFLGRHTGPDKFEFLYDDGEKRVLQALARKTAEATGEERFAINVPFHSYLQITSSQTQASTHS